MPANAIILQGTLAPDGTLQLDEKPSLPAGRVQVTIQPIAQPAERKGDWWECLQRIRAEREASGYPFMTEAEGAAFIEELRSGDERLEEIYRQAEESRRTAE